MTISKLRILVTGGNGFVGRRLVAKLATLPEAPDVIVGTLHRNSGSPSSPGVRHVEFDVTSIKQVRSVIAAEQPTHIIHLAAVAAPAEAQRSPREAWHVNADGAVNVALATLEAAPQSRLLHCSSAEVYGHAFRKGEPVDESAPLEPANVYGAGKAAADLMIGQMCKLGLRALRLRPFNHTGPEQSEDFVVPAFAAQIARIERGFQEPVIRVGDLTPHRDFLDVDDVVEAYVAAITRFDELPPACVLNVASGRGVAIEAILNALLSYSDINIEVRPDPDRVRRSDIPVAIGNAELLHRLLNWAPKIDWDCTLRSVLDFQRGCCGRPAR
jgi:GDP-4-dehydro-6-deoxy-D-mannose reductase